MRVQEIHDDGLPSDRLMFVAPSAATAELLGLIDEVTAAQGWDLGLGMLAVYRYADGFALLPVEFPEPYASQPPDVRVPGYAEAAWRDPRVRAGLEPLFTASFHGWIIVFEGWDVKPVGDYPPRELRFIILAGPDGKMAQLTRLRGQAGADDVVQIDEGWGGRFSDAARRYADLGARVLFLRARAAAAGNEPTA